MNYLRKVLQGLAGTVLGLGLVSVPLAFAYASTSVSIQSLSPSSSVNIGTNVSFSVLAAGFTTPTYAVSDSASGGSSISSGNINSSGNFSWTPGGNDIGTHNLTLTVGDSSGLNATTTLSETITVSAAPSVSIQNLSPSSSVASGQTVSFSVSTSGFSSPSFSAGDSFSGSSVTSSSVNSSGNFSWTPGTNDVGTHTIIINVSDTSGHSASATETITVASASSAGTTGTGGAAIQGLSPGTTVVIGNPVTFTVAASGFSNPVFSVSDSFGGTSVSNADINTAGYFTWTPNSNDVGTHNLTIYVNDSSGHSGNVTLSLTVQQPNIVITSITPSTVVLPNSPLSFTVSPAGFTNPTYTLNDSFSGTSITNANINSSGNFTWTPGTNQDGAHTITVYATDSLGHSANTSITITVNSGVSVTLTALSPGTTIAPGATGSLVAYAYGFNTPTFSVADSFAGSSINNADINSSGYFTWTPTVNDVGTHVVTITATDAYSHTSSAQATITVSSAGASSGSTLSTLEAQLAQVEAKLSAAQSGASSSSASGFVFSNYLSPGITSNDVTQLQTVLTQQGMFSGPITGYYGTLTENAVIAFQAAHGLDQLGVVGPATRAALNALASGSTTASSSTNASTTGDGYVFSNLISYGDTSTDVQELQTRLTALGVYSGPITSYFGDLTRAAVEQFQGVHGIAQVGYVGPATRAALNQ